MLAKPERPFVALPDLLIALGLACLLWSAEGLVFWYVLSGVALFTVSSVHHWLSYERWHHSLDMTMILLVIAMTPLPYIERIHQQGYEYIYYITVLLAFVGSIYTFIAPNLERGAVLNVLYISAFSFGSLTLVGVGLLPDWSTYYLWLGVFLYVVQAAMFKFYIPNKKWYRECQHLVLYMAFFCHLSILI